MSSPSPQPSLASLLPVSPDSKLLFWTGRGATGLSPREIQGMIERARSGDFWIGHYDVPEIIALKALALAIDPETGDSLLHIAAASTCEPLAVQEVIAQTTQRSCGLDRSVGPRQRALESLLMHQNYAGDSVLHVAARSGVQRATTYLYRAFWNDESRDCLDWTTPPLSDSDITTPEFQRIEDPRDNDIRGKCLAFLLLPNKEGHTASDAARFAGHADVAIWLENIVLLLDPDGEFKPLRDIPDVIREELWGQGK